MNEMPMDERRAHTNAGGGEQWPPRVAPQYWPNHQDALAHTSKALPTPHKGVQAHKTAQAMRLENQRP